MDAKPYRLLLMDSPADRCTGVARRFGLSPSVRDVRSSPPSMTMRSQAWGVTSHVPHAEPLLQNQRPGAGANDIRRERRDAAVSAMLMFFVSAAVVAVATGALFAHGKTVDRVLDMAATLEPVAGSNAVTFFMVGVLSAGLSSVFPIMMVAPLLVEDWRSGEVKTRTPLFRALCLAAALAGLSVTALGANPVSLTVAAQVSNVFVLPLAVAAAIALLNNRSAMREHKAGWLMNSMLAAALIFSVCVAIAGAKSLSGCFKTGKERGLAVRGVTRSDATAIRGYDAEEL